MKIYTKKGDLGDTTLVDGRPISKGDARIHTYGTVDELNSQVGLMIAMLETEAAFKDDLPGFREIQNWLFHLGSQLACSDPEMAKKLPTIDESQIQQLEKQMDQWDKELPPLKNFILPGGHMASAQAHVCRTVSRRAERACVGLNSISALSFPAIAFLNRISDYFFVLARLINSRTGKPSIEWKA